jgi:acetyltransferase
VVLKLLSHTITHKSDVGGVQLNLPDADAVRKAFVAIQGHVPPDAFGGVTVQPMVGVKGQELIVGSSVDRQFGPVILFGAGGVLVEVFKDRELALPPLNRTLARRLIERTKISQALKGVRGQKSIDLGALETLLVRFSQLVADFLDIREIDINPLLASPECIVALDARVLLAPADAPTPRLAITPYPNQLTARFRLKDGSELTVRALAPEDEPLIVALHGGHSPQTIRMRFHSMVKTLSRDSMIRLCHLDYDREMALLAVRHNGEQPQALGVSRYYLHPETGVAEFAIVVGDPWQGQGLGWHLMERLIEVARQRGVKQLIGTVLRENAPMLQLAQELGFTMLPTSEPSVVEAIRELTP